MTTEISEESMVDEETGELIPKYTIFYIPLGLTEVYACDCDEFNFTTFDIKSFVTKETITYPIVVAMNNKDDSIDHIMMNTVINIKYNWGLGEYNRKYEEFKKTHAKDIEALERAEYIEEENNIYG